MTRYPTNRERLMDAAGELFYKEGLHAITAERVADHTGLTRPIIYNLFGSKDALVAKTLQRRGEQIRRHIEERAAALVLEGAAAMSAVQAAEIVAKHARAAARALIASHK